MVSHYGGLFKRFFAQKNVTVQPYATAKACPEKTARTTQRSQRGRPFPKNRHSFSQSDSQTRSKPQPRRLAARSGRGNSFNKTSAIAGAPNRSSCPVPGSCPVRCRGQVLKSYFFTVRLQSGIGFKRPLNLFDALAIRCAGLHNCHIALQP